MMRRSGVLRAGSACSSYRHLRSPGHSPGPFTAPDDMFVRGADVARQMGGASLR
jgi:hypothetical protein